MSSEPGIAPIRNAIISVSDKMGLAAFARGLTDAGVVLYSTGGTRAHLAAEGIEARDVAEYTGFPEMMGGRIKTLHPKIHGGILYRRDNPDDVKAIEQHSIVPFDLVVVNLYPFQATVSRPGVTDAEAIEQIDIGGPSLVRAAAKNHAAVTVATNAASYAAILDEIAAHGGTTFALRRRLAGEAFSHTAHYDLAIAGYFARGASDSEFPETLELSMPRKAILRYGENPHQAAALYAEQGESTANLVAAQQLNGKELSYNNLLDLDAALSIVRPLRYPAAAVIKHNNPCGAAEGDVLEEAARKALAGDPVSAFGGVLAFNRPLDEATAEVLTEPGNFIEAIVAPAIYPAALTILTTRPKWKSNVRLLQVGPLNGPPKGWDFRRVAGGLLVQNLDLNEDPEDEWRVVTERQPTAHEWQDLRFAWSIVRFVKSNAIALAKDRMLLGAGAGQMSRVDSVEIAIRKAGERASGAAMSSDAFFPFDDSVRLAAAAGVTCAIQPGGSRNDAQVIDACNELGMAMVFTGRRHFRH